MKLILALLLILAMRPLIAQTDQDIRPIAEYEPTGHIWMPYSTGSDEMNSAPEDSLLIPLIQNLATSVLVLFDVRDSSSAAGLGAKLMAAGIDMERMRYIITERGPPGAYRDVNPAFMEKKDGSTVSVDMGWGCYGLVEPGHPQAVKDGKYDRYISELFGIPVEDSSTVIWEGGAAERNSKGILMLVEQFEFDRNPHMTREVIEAEHLRVLNAKKVIWLKKGPWEDEYRTELPGGVYPVGCGGHIDEFCRFVNDSTILLAEVWPDDLDPISRENHQRMEENYNILRNATDENGRPFHIIRVPMPEHHIFEMKYEDAGPLYQDYFPGKKQGDTVRVIAATSYVNFIVANDLVITSKYWKEGRSEKKRIKDAAVLEIFTRAFPSERIVQLDMEGYNNYGGGLHCLTMNIPEIVVPPPGVVHRFR